MYASSCSEDPNRSDATTTTKMQALLEISWDEAGVRVRHAIQCGKPRSTLPAALPYLDMQIQLHMHTSTVVSVEPTSFERTAILPMRSSRGDVVTRGPAYRHIVWVRLEPRVDFAALIPVWENLRGC